MVYRYYSIRSRRVDGMVDWGHLNQKQTSKEKKKRALQNKLRMWNFIPKTIKGSTQVE